MTIKMPSPQLPLLSVAPFYNCVKNAEARNAYGQAAQEIACAALRLTPIPIDGNYDICFDATDGRTFYEIKSVKRNGKLVLYDWRPRKESQSGVRVKYIAVQHRLKNEKVDILKRMIEEGVLIEVFDLAHVVEVAMTMPLKKISHVNHPENSRIGYNRAGYREGCRNVSVKLLRKSMTSKIEFVQVYNHFGNIEIRHES